MLVDGDDMNEPVADAVRAILDGHVVLSRDLAHAGHYPAIDVLASVSRLIDQIVPADIRMAGQELRKLMAALREKEDLISIGAYQMGTDPVVDTAIAKREEIAAFLQQTVEHCSTGAEADAALLELVLGGIPEELLADMPRPTRRCRSSSRARRRYRLCIWRSKSPRYASSDPSIPATGRRAPRLAGMAVSSGGHERGRERPRRTPTKTAAA